MLEFIFYSLLSVFFLALPLYLYKHPPWVVLLSSLAELLAIVLLYASTFILCSDEEVCGASWATWAIPALIAAMNIGMVWPILAGYAKQAEKDQERQQKSQGPDKT